MAYAIMRLAKHKVGATSLAAMGEHMGRHRDTPNADPARRGDNRTWTPAGGWVSWAEREPVRGSQVAAVEARLADFRARGGRVQKNAVACLEAILTASPEAFAAPGFDLDEWAEAQIAWASKVFGAANVVEAVMHLDESTPHVHLLVVPEVLKAETRGRRPRGSEKGSGALKPCLAANDFVGDRAKLSELQSDYAGDMARFGLERGVRGSRANHKAVRHWYGEIAEREAERAETVRVLGTLGERTEAAFAESVALQAEVDRLRLQVAELPDLRRKAARLARHEADIRAMDILREHAPASHQYVLDRAEAVLQAAIDRDVERLQAGGGDVAAAPGFD